MKRIFTLLFYVIFLSTFSVLLISWSGNGNHDKSSGGAPAGYAKDPAGGNLDCNDCHMDGASSQFSQVRPGMITSDIPVDGYVAGNTYTITATVIQSGHTMFGFEISPQNPSGTLLGTLIASAETQLVGSSKYITHKGSSISGTGSKTWTFQWTAPATGLGPVTFYGAFNVCDNDGSDAGDSVYTSTYQVAENGVGISQIFNPENDFTVYPLFSDGQFTIENKNFQGKTFGVSIYNVNGQIVLQKEVNTYKEFINLNKVSGIYYIWIKNGEDNILKKVIVV